jgi:hypothetical protein
MTVFSLLFARGPEFITAAVLLAVLGFAGGFFAVPVMAIIQHRPDPARKGAVIAASNQMSFIGVGAASSSMLRSQGSCTSLFPGCSSSAVS